jgi:hypothetical protein
MASVLVKQSTIGYDETMSALVGAIERRRQASLSPRMRHPDKRA